ncbi:MAG: hypothetical protein LBV77_02165, partial [Candidatus Adiutrix intracellularis]|nr:hypothetical protein [Candidatus Adiutrix intracellularis]
KAKGGFYKIKILKRLSLSTTSLKRVYELKNKSAYFFVLPLFPRVGFETFSKNYLKEKSFYLPY